MKRLQFLLMIFVAGLISCSNDDDTAYPSLITEMSMAYSNGQGLLSRFVTDSGRDYRASNDIKGMDANETVRALISYVPDNDSQAKVYSAQVIPVLPDATDKEPVAHDPLGVESVWLGGGFINLHLLPKSQGQKQRILIARAVYKNPKFILLDEATNSLDASNERAIVEKLNTFYKGRTVVVVAHRLSTVKNADQIIVLDKGKDVETGNHLSLTAKRGAYYNLVKNQLELGN